MEIPIQRVINFKYSVWMEGVCADDKLELNENIVFDENSVSADSLFSSSVFFCVNKYYILPPNRNSKYEN